MPKQYSDVSQMSLMPEIPILGIIWKLLDPENQNIEFSEYIFQAPLNTTSDCKNLFVFPKIKSMTQKLQNKLTSI